MQDAVTTTDLYESCYYLLNGCELSGIECIKINGKITCRLSFRGEEITGLQLQYFHGKAQANLFDFRRTFGQVYALVNSEKKKAKRQTMQGNATQEGGAE